MARRLLGQHRQLFELKLFAGRILYSPTRLPDQTEVISRRDTDGACLKVKISRTQEVKPDTDVWYQLVNILFRQLQRKLGYAQIGRHFYDPNAENSIRALVSGHNISLWPGFLTSLLPLETGLVLCAKIAFKVTFTSSILDMITGVANENQRNPSEIHRAVEHSIVGYTVMTPYNNKTYRINEVLWDVTPSDTFEKMVCKSAL